MNSITATGMEPPMPTTADPYVQIDWIWNLFLKQYENQETIKKYKACLSSYKGFLHEVNGYDKSLKTDRRFMLAIHWNQFAVSRAGQFWLTKFLNKSTVDIQVYMLRQIVEFAAESGLTADSHFIYPLPEKRPRFTTVRAYGDEELNIIHKIIEEGVAYARNITQGYKRTGVGND